MLRQCINLLCLSVSISAWGAGIGSSLPGPSGLSAQKHLAWHAVGPAPPAIQAPIVADAASHTIYIGSAGSGVLKSTDGGATFLAVNNGLGGSIVTGIVMAPNNPNVVYANTQFDGFYKTIDGGARWSGGNWGGFTLLMDPGNPNILYSASGPFDYVQKSTDGGDTWSYAADGLGEASIFALAIDLHNSNVLYAGSIGQGAYKSTDGAATWTRITIDTNVSALLVDPDNSNVIYAGTDGHGVYKSTNGGRSFARVGSPKVTSILALAKSGQTLYAGTATQGVSESVDGGRTWRNSDVSSGMGNVLSVDSAGSVYTGTNFDGAFVRSVSDSDWRRIGWNQLRRCKCQNGDALAIDPADHNHLIFTTNAGGLLVTEDGGRSWRDGGTEGLTSNGPRSVAFDPQEPRRVYAGSVWGGGLFKSEDHGKHWQRREFGPADVFVSGVAVDPVDHSVYAATLTNGSGLWKSTDYGETFTRIDRAPGAPAGVYLGLSGRTVTVDPHNHATIYLPDSGAVTGIWRSRDAGKSWEQVDATDSFISVTVDPTNSNIVYASSVNGSGGHAVLKSIDGGFSFSAKSTGLPVGFQTANTGFLLVNPEHSNVLYVAFEYVGVFKSTDAAESWLPINLGLGDLTITGLAMDPDSPDTLYAATWYKSVFKTVTGGR
jgi:photosystem II stability/assembly factor-like uncharacterized protein